MDQWGLTEKGFKRPSYNELLDAFEIKAKELFGSTINLSSRSALGIFLRIFAWVASLLWQTAEDVYNSSFLDTAVGISLARLGAFIGIRVLAALKATGTITITGDPGSTIYAGFIVAATNNQRFVTTKDAIIPSAGTVDIPIQAMAAGPDGNVPAGTITTVITPIAGSISVVNGSAISGGRNKETDQQFRIRYAESVDIAGGSNTDAIRAKLLEVSGVQEAKVFENDTDVIDANGLPPHSVAAIVLDGSTTDIAKAIHSSKAGGIQTYGDESSDVIDASGTIRTIYFSRPLVKLVYAQITDLLTDTNFPADGNDLIVSALIAYISGLSIGETVYYKQLIRVINTVPGVMDYDMAIGTDGVSYAKDNIPIGNREKASSSPDKVVVSP